VGCLEGCPVGLEEGWPEGREDGCTLGCPEGWEDGLPEGTEDG